MFRQISKFKKQPNMAQSILEYTLLLGVVIAIVVAVMLKDTGKVQTGVKGTYEKAGAALDSAANKIDGSVLGIGGD